MGRKRINVVDARILVLGLTFKEDCPDLRNTRVVEIVRELQAAQAKVDVYDPLADASEAELEHGIQLIDAPLENSYDAIVLAVAHRQFNSTEKSVRRFGKPNHVVFDVKSELPPGEFDGRL